MFLVIGVIDKLYVFKVLFNRLLGIWYFFDNIVIGNNLL